MSLPEEIKKEVDEIIADYRSLAPVKSLKKAWKFIRAALPDFVQIAEKMEGMDGEDKQETVIAALEYSWDELKIDIPWVPDRLIFKLLPFIIDIVVDLMNKGGLFKKEAVESV